MGGSTDAGWTWVPKGIELGLEQKAAEVYRGHHRGNQARQPLQLAVWVSLLAPSPAPAVQSWRLEGPAAGASQHTPARPAWEGRDWDWAKNLNRLTINTKTHANRDIASYVDVARARQGVLSSSKEGRSMNQHHRQAAHRQP